MYVARLTTGATGQCRINVQLATNLDAYGTRMLLSIDLRCTPVSSKKWFSGVFRLWPVIWLRQECATPNLHTVRRTLDLDLLSIEIMRRACHPKTFADRTDASVER